MREYSQILLLAGSLITGILVIFLSHKLLRKYNLPYLSSYFYYLIFLFVFGIYGLIGSRLIRILLINQSVAPGAIEHTCLLVSYIGLPFLVLSWYMFIRLSREMVHKKIAPGFNFAFFIFLTVIFVLFGFLLVERDFFGEQKFLILRRIMLLSLSGISVLVYGYALIRLCIESSRQLDNRDRHNILLFAFSYMIFAALTLILVNLAGQNEFFAYGLVVVLFSIHLIPVFFQTLHLDKYYAASFTSPDLNRNMEEFIRQYNISKRETEIIQLICRGKSNQDISDSLFISLQTVKDHVHHIYLKTGVKNRVQLTNLIRSFS